MTRNEKITATQGAEILWQRTGKLLVKVDPLQPATTGEITYQFSGCETDIPFRYARPGHERDWKSQMEILMEYGIGPVGGDRLGWPIWEMEVAD